MTLHPFLRICAHLGVPPCCTSCALQPVAVVQLPCNKAPPVFKHPSPRPIKPMQGKIKGVARTLPQCQSARGFGTARRLHAAVPSWRAKPDGLKVSRVPSSMRYATLRWSLCHGLA
jgi:hypothetical protein